MRVWQILVSVRLAFLLVLASHFAGGLSSPAWAAEKQGGIGSLDSDELTDPSPGLADDSPVALSEIPTLNQLEHPATTVVDWVAQIEASIVQITGVRVEDTEAGLRLVLEAENGSLAVSETRSVGNALIADIPNATIAEEFSQAEPIEGIALVNVSSLTGDRVRVAITGTDASPVAEVTSEAQGLAFAVTLGEARTAADEDAIQVVVTGEQDEGYNPSRATTATRTDTPLRDIPASITVIPQQVIEDRGVNSLGEALETASGVTSSDSIYGISGGGSIIRGFRQVGTLRDGLPQGNEFYTLEPIGTIERVEILRGPASVLFGSLEPGGVINTVTRQPLSEPYYRLEFEAGNRDFYQPNIDLSGPLTADGSVLYRLIAGYEASNDIRDFVNFDQVSVAPSLTVNFSDRTSLDLYYEYTRVSGNLGFFAPAILDEDGDLLSPREFLSTYPSLDEGSAQTQKFGYRFNHRLSDNLQLRNNLAITLDRYDQNGVLYGELRDDRFLVFTNGFGGDVVNNRSTYFGQIDLLATFDTGSISHQVVVGFDADITELEQNILLYDTSTIPDLDIFNPNYDIPTPNFTTSDRGQDDRDFNLYGVYLQDQIEFSDNLKLLIGGRYDWVSTNFDLTVFGSDVTQQNNGAFSPRLGLVYQPSETVSLYASYSRSFRPSFFDRSADGERNFDPTRGTQYEVGAKLDFLDGRLSTTLAAYHLTRTNVVTPDPDPVLASQGFSVQTGEQRSQGIELDIAGEILPGWNIIGSYTYTDAEVTQDNSFPEGNQLANVPFNQASLWTTYEIQEGILEGLGFGLGLFYVGERQGDLSNSFQLDDYFRTDAALFYRRDGFRAAINVRNLFDIDYVSYAEGRIWPVTRGEPFTIVGSVSWEF